MNRRSLLKTAGSLAGAAALGSAAHAAQPRSSAARPKLQFQDAEFYKDGKFDVEKGKDAVVAMCQYHGFPIFPGFRDKLWVSDYNQGEYTKLGLAACMYMNHVKDRYMLMDLFILPGQMLPEHWHVPADGNPAKLEGWLVRCGLSHIVGVGEANLGPEIVIPKFHCGGTVTVKHEVAATPGVFVPLAEAESRHWQYGGPEGAIVTEVANVHTDAGVRHSDPKLNDYFLSLIKK
jgi:hypothetical protein